MWKCGNPRSLLVGMENDATTVENSIRVPQNITRRITLWSSNSASGYTPKRIESRISKRYLYHHVQSNIIHNNQEVETTQVSIDRWRDKQNVVNKNSRILSSCIKEGNPVTCYTMDEPWGHYTKWNKPITKGQILYDSTYMM